MIPKSDSSSLYCVARRIDRIARITVHCGTILGMRVGPLPLIAASNRVFALVRYVLENIHTIDLSITDLETLSQSLRDLTAATTKSQIDRAVAVSLYTLKLKTEADLEAYMRAQAAAADATLHVSHAPEARLILINETDTGKSTPSTRISEGYKIDVQH